MAIAIRLHFDMLPPPWPPAISLEWAKLRVRRTLSRFMVTVDVVRRNIGSDVSQLQRVKVGQLSHEHLPGQPTTPTRMA